jgi:hypothetical protein
MRIGGLVVGVHVLVDWQDVWLRQTLLALLSDLGMK